MIMLKLKTTALTAIITNDSMMENILWVLAGQGRICSQLLMGKIKTASSGEYCTELAL